MGMWDMGIANPSGRQFSTIFTTVLRTPYLFPAEPVVTLRRDKRGLFKPKLSITKQSRWFPAALHNLSKISLLQEIV